MKDKLLPYRLKLYNNSSPKGESYQDYPNYEIKPTVSDNTLV